jgi:hypothetical protein
MYILKNNVFGVFMGFDFIGVVLLKNPVKLQLEND